MPTNQFRQPGNLLVGKITSVKESMMILGPAPLVVPMIQEHKKPPLVSHNVIRNSARPKFVSMTRQELVPLVTAATKRHGVPLLSFIEHRVRQAARAQGGAELQESVNPVGLKSLFTAL
jgi:tetrahydromethanopterin S-methyltransferase subunit D